MNITHLKYAVEVSRTGSISQAAENLYMSQPNLSKAIREFETSLGFSIFKRNSKGIEPTEKGQEFLNYARGIIAQIDEIEMLYSGENTPKEKFNISVPRASYISYAFTKFVNKLAPESEIELKFNETNSISAVNNICDEDYSLGIIRCQTKNNEFYFRLLKDKGMSYKMLFEFEYRLLLSKDSRFAQYDVVPANVLSEGIEIVHGDLKVPFLSNKEVITDSVKPTKKKIYVYERGSQFDLLRNVDNTYMWVSPMPEDTLKNYGLIQKNSTAQRNKYNDILVYEKNHRFSDNETSFLHELDNVKKEISRII